MSCFALWPFLLSGDVSTRTLFLWRQLISAWEMAPRGHSSSARFLWLWPPGTFPDPFLVLPFGHGPRGCIGQFLVSSSYFSFSNNCNPNKYFDNGYMIFESPIIQIGRKLAEDSLVLLLIHLFARFRCWCELVSSSHLLQTTNPPCVVLTISNFLYRHWDCPGFNICSFNHFISVLHWDCPGFND